MNEEQVTAMTRLLEHLAENYASQLVDEGAWDDLLIALRRLYLRLEGLPHPPETYEDLD